MAEEPNRESNRRRIGIVIAIIAILIAALFLLVQCPKKPVTPPQVPAVAPPPAQNETPAVPQAAAPPATTPEAEEQLTPATVTAPQSIAAGAIFNVEWSGPNNPGDFITIVKPDADAKAYANYMETDKGNPLTLTAPIEAGPYEVRYVATRSRTILGRAPIEVMPIEATVTAPTEAIAGVTIQVAWTGPNNDGDYITIVGATIPDGQYGHYTYTTKGSPLDLLTPIDAGDAEIRYMTGQGARVLARQAIKIIAANVTLSAPSEAVAASDIDVTWTGPNNRGDYITIVTKTTPDGQYGAYTYTTQGSPLKIKALAEAGEAEIRYMTGQGNKVLARIAIRIIPG